VQNKILFVCFVILKFSSKCLSSCNLCFQHTDGTPQSEVHLVALHSYESSNPEDLNFHQGDTITLITKSETPIFWPYRSQILKIYCDAYEKYDFNSEFHIFSLVNQDWLEGQCSGTTGIFPASFVEEVPVNGRSLEWIHVTREHAGARNTAEGPRLKSGRDPRPKHSESTTFDESHIIHWWNFWTL